MSLKNIFRKQQNWQMIKKGSYGQQESNCSKCKSALWLKVIDLHKSEVLTLTAGSGCTAAYSQYVCVWGGAEWPRAVPYVVNPAPLQELILDQ